MPIGSPARKLLQDFATIGMEVRYDVRGETFVYRSTSTSESKGQSSKNKWLPYGPKVMASHFALINAHHGSDRWPSGPARKDVLLTYAAYPLTNIDFFLKWLQSLPSWDGTKRIDNLLGNLFTIGNDPPVTVQSIFKPSPPSSDSNPALAKNKLRSFFKSAIERALDPGKEWDRMPVLVGPPGIGKRAFFEGLIPDLQKYWFAPDLDIDVGEITLSLYTRGKVIVGLNEIRKTLPYVHRLRSYLLRTHDLYEDHLASKWDFTPRRFVIVATSRDTALLTNNPYGDHFELIQVASKTGVSVAAIKTRLAADREQLWAEMLKGYTTPTTPPRRHRNPCYGYGWEDSLL